jgi:hypothetical protein
MLELLSRKKHELKEDLPALTRVRQPVWEKTNTLRVWRAPLIKQTGVCFSLDLECPSKARVLKAWSPACGTIGRDGTFSGWGLREKVRSLRLWP